MGGAIRKSVTQTPASMCFEPTGVSPSSHSMSTSFPQLRYNCEFSPRISPETLIVRWCIKSPCVESGAPQMSESSVAYTDRWIKPSAAPIQMSGSSVLAKSHLCVYHVFSCCMPPILPPAYSCPTVCTDAACSSNLVYCQTTKEG